MNELLVIDTETGGLDPANHSILSLGAVVWREGEVSDGLEIFIAEPAPVAEPQALAVSGLDMNWLKENGKPPGTAVQTLESFLHSHFPSLQQGQRINLAGHNVDFDAGFLKRLYRLAGANYSAIFSHRYLDTASVIRFLILAGKLPLCEAGSESIFNYFGIRFDPGKRHTALADAQATAILLTRLLTQAR